jgi:hypothetical protein
MSGNAAKVKSLLKQNASATLTRQLLSVPEGGKTIKLASGQPIKVTAASKASAASKAK